MSDYGYYGNGSNSGNSGNSNSNGYSSSSDNSYSQNTGSTNNGYGQGTGAANNTYGSNSYSNYNYGASGYNAYGQNGYNSYNQGNPYKQAAPKKPRKEHPTLKKAGKLVAAGLIFGLCEWIHYASLGLGAPTGTIMVAVLTFILGFQMLLSAAQYDISAPNPFDKR